MIKTIYLLWFQGFDDNATPDVVKRCAKSWQHYNPDWNIVLLDAINLGQYIPLHQLPAINKTALSDVVRLLLLCKPETGGGVWADATTFCNRPLNDWLPDVIAAGFFAFANPGPDRMLSSWFIYAEPTSYIVQKLCAVTVQYFRRFKQPHFYFWFHYLFGYLYRSDPQFQRIWDKVPKRPANGRMGPHRVQDQGMFRQLTSLDKADIDNKMVPLYKLTYKCTFPNYDKALLVYYLFSTIEDNAQKGLKEGDDGHCIIPP